jgi:Flp pilus assembly protein TadD
MTVRAWYEKVTIPTYGTGKPEKHPMFLEKRVYQGSSGVVYPFPVTEKIMDVKQDREWNAIFIENRYLKIMILPELGGRIQMAWDKSMQRHFVYYNQVIKPALVGLTGPWISGGIEFNWPQHHRPSTFDPVDHCIEENDDGSVTVWCSEVERMFRTRGMAGFTLHPDKAYLEIRVKLYNRTDQPQTFLWWANPAVKVNDHYQSVFPPDVHAVFDHGKRDVSEFPIARGTYYKVDYAPGTDISRYKNIPVPTSYMAISSKYDFLGGYEHDTKGGLLHVANHHISPGKKQWTWGHSDFGKAWDRNLTDEDGPYIEIMCGVYTDNQPDFSWLMPGEEKSFSQYFMPYRDIGVVKNATKEAMINLETDAGIATLRAFTTGVYEDAKVRLTCGNAILIEETFRFHPATSYSKTIALPENGSQDALKAMVMTSGDEVLVEWTPEEPSGKPLPSRAIPAGEPREIESVEQLYLTGLHLEQYRHAIWSPPDYYHEALRRDPKESRVNNALGLWHLRRGRFAEAEYHFRQAITTLTERNPNPIDGEPFYNLGVTLIFSGKDEEALQAFYKSVWNAAWQDSGYFQLARLALKANRKEEALDLAGRSLARNQHHHKVRHLLTAILRKLGRTQAAITFLNRSLEMDKFNFGILFEDILLHPDDPQKLKYFRELIRGNIHTYMEFSLDYAGAGLYREADSLISLGIEEQGR